MQDTREVQAGYQGYRLDPREVQVGYQGSKGWIPGSTGWIPGKYKLDTREVQVGYQGSKGWIPGKYRLDTREVGTGCIPGVLAGYQGSTTWIPGKYKLDTRQGRYFTAVSNAEFRGTGKVSAVIKPKFRGDSAGRNQPFCGHSAENIRNSAMNFIIRFYQIE